MAQRGPQAFPGPKVHKGLLGRQDLTVLMENPAHRANRGRKGLRGRPDQRVL